MLRMKMERRGKTQNLFLISSFLGVKCSIIYLYHSKNKCFFTFLVDFFTSEFIIESILHMKLHLKNLLHNLNQFSKIFFRKTKF